VKTPYRIVIGAILWAIFVIFVMHVTPSTSGSFPLIKTTLLILTIALAIIFVLVFFHRKKS
jgi:uncharacterized protein with PQ loop repeat